MAFGTSCATEIVRRVGGGFLVTRRIALTDEEKPAAIEKNENPYFKWKILAECNSGVDAVKALARITTPKAKKKLTDEEKAAIAAAAKKARREGPFFTIGYKNFQNGRETIVAKFPLTQAAKAMAAFDRVADKNDDVKFDHMVFFLRTPDMEAATS